MKQESLYYVAVPCTEEVLNLIKLFSITINTSYDRSMDCTVGCGLFIYTNYLCLEAIDNETEWLLEDKDAIQVLALYSNKDFNGICEYLNTMPNRPINVHADTGYLSYKN